MHELAVILAPGSINHIANIVKGYAIALGVAFAVWFVWQWWQTRQREMATEIAARTKAVWSRHLGLALQHPELAEPMPGSMASAGETARYQTFVASLLATADEILALSPTESWQNTIARALGPHRSYLASADARETVLMDCSEAVRYLVSRVAGV